MQTKDSTLFFRVISTLCYAILVVFVFVKGAIFFPDSYGFLEMDFHRSIGYNAFLKVFTTIFSDAFEMPVILVQVALLIVTSLYLLKTIRSLFSLPDHWVLLIQLILLAPAFYLHYVANTILSEGLTYPLFLLFVAFVLKGFVSMSRRHYYYAIVVLFALLSIRGQFIAMVPVLVILVILDALERGFSKKVYILLASILLLPLISGLAGRTYNKLVYGHFEKTPFSKVSLITPAFFVADEVDHNLFEDSEQKQFFKQVYSTLDGLGLTKDKVLASGSEPYIVFHADYSKVCNLSIHETGTNYFATQGLDREQQLIAINDLCGDMLVPLIKDNFQDWLKLYIDNLKNAFGSAKQLLLFLLLLVTSLVLIFKRKQDLAKFIFATILMVFANMCIVPLAVHSLKRYVFYSDWVLFTIVILLLYKVFENKTSDV